MLALDPDFADFYDDLYEVVKDRVARGIAAVPNEEKRVMSDTQPPWGFLKIYRHLEKWGVVINRISIFLEGLGRKKIAGLIGTDGGR